MIYAKTPVWPKYKSEVPISSIDKIIWVDCCVGFLINRSIAPAKEGIWSSRALLSCKALKGRYNLVHIPPDFYRQQLRISANKNVV
jgi:hypothetical protein